MNLNKHINEGWTVQDFIDDLELSLDMIQTGRSHFKKIETLEELKKWCMENQPYYKKHIPEVVKYFSNKYNIK